MTGTYVSDVTKVDKNQELYKDVVNGTWSTFGADLFTKREVFEISDPSQLRNDRIIIANQYLFNPLFAESHADAPEYVKDLCEVVNIRGDTLNNFSKMWLIFSNSK
jgi:hypothetical protein